MDIFATLIRNLSFILLSTVSAVGIFSLYNRFPPAWFIERQTGTKHTVRSETAEHSLLSKFPDGAIFISGIVISAFIFFIKDGYSLILICNLFSMVFLMMISAADIKTGIIPDQFTAGLMFSSLFWMAYDIFLVQAADKDWYEVFTTRIVAGLIGGITLFITGLAGRYLLKKESVGMGDVKMMFACGLVVDLKGIMAVFVLSFLLALIPALIGLFNRRRSFDRLPFAPFISAATFVFLIFPEEIAFLSSLYGGLL